jgi:hypothetical protein
VAEAILDFESPDSTRSESTPFERPVRRGNLNNVNKQVTINRFSKRKTSVTDGSPLGF